MAFVPLLAGSQRRERPNVRPPNVIAIALLALAIVAGLSITIPTENPIPVIAGVLIGLVLMQSPKIAQQWERAIILRLGRFEAMRGPGLFWVVPFIDRIATWIDQRTITTSFAAEQ